MDEKDERSIECNQLERNTFDDQTMGVEMIFLLFLLLLLLSDEGIDTHACRKVPIHIYMCVYDGMSCPGVLLPLTAGREIGGAESHDPRVTMIQSEGTDVSGKNCI